jgi:tetratricopeptide (TPR) repeat protein
MNRLGLSLVLTLTAGFAIAVQPPAPATTPLSSAANEREPASSRFTVRQRAAFHLARAALLDLRLIESPSETDYRIADLMFSLAQDLSPDDPELVRRRIEASWNAGQPEEALRQTRRLLVLDPSDTVAQLRVVSAAIAKAQTVPERLALAEKFSGSLSLDASVRSRIALDAALLARESGDNEAFRANLTRAASLDSTNKEAAVLAVSTFMEQNPGDARGRLELMSNLLMADPHDPLVWLAIAEQLAEHGAFEQADRMHKNGRDLLKMTGGEVSQEDEVEALVLQWQTQGPAKVFNRINSNLLSQRNSMMEYNKKVRDQGVGVAEDYGEPDDLRLGAETEKVRLATAIASENAEGAKSSMRDMTRSVEFMLESAVDDRKRPPGFTKEAALEQANAAILDLQFWRVLANLDTDKVDADLAAFKGVAGDGQPGPEIVRGLLALRQGDASGSLAKIDKVLETLPEGELVTLTAEYCRGLALEALGRKPEALASLRKVQRGYPTKPIGAMARYQVDRIIGQPDVFSADREAVEAIAKAIPMWVDQMISSPKTFMTVLAESEPKSTFGDPAPVIVTLRNVSPIDLALGSDKPINSRFMFAPILTGRSTTIGPLMRPDVAELDRRLRLAPRETIRVTVYPEQGHAGLVLELTSDRQARVAWQALQGYLPSKGGNFLRGPISLAADTRAIERDPISESTLTSADLVGVVKSSSGNERFRALLAVRQRLWMQSIETELAELTAEIAAERAVKKPTAPVIRPSATEATRPDVAAASGTSIPASVGTAQPPTESTTAAEERAKRLTADRVELAKSMTDLLPTLDDTDRILLLAMMPHAGQIAEMADFDAAARSALADGSLDPGVAMITLLTRVTKPDDLRPVAASSDARLRELAALLSVRLSTEGKSYARLVGGLRALRDEVKPEPQ